MLEFGKSLSKMTLKNVNKLQMIYTFSIIFEDESPNNYFTPHTNQTQVRITNLNTTKVDS